MSTFEILVIGIILMFVSAQCGAKIQKTVKFLYPVDPFTVSLMAACISVMIIQKPFEWFWYLPVIFGYILGFVIVGRTSYIMLRYLQPNIRHSDADPWVFYHDKNGNMCVQDQSWRQLLKRIFLGVHHYVLCDSDLAPNWVESTHHPFIPRFRIQVMYVEYLSTEEEEVCLKESRKLPKNGEKPRGLYVKQRISYIKAAHGSQVSLAELIADAGALDKANSRIEELEKEIYWLRKEATTVTTSLIGMFIKDNYAKSPLVLALSSRISRLNKKEEKTITEVTQ
ncbi:hypothetical protein [Candidatus Methanomassiliicoccus intestinalis]|jgi:hypothetical protein|uniref:Uncharacterized protein n=2 Tax=Candidatus Methanomassiliicoccus intestinalis TaxID=1406512 RepID=R9T806_METII|nr:hypothetical protein [Candidatus Methanomassiliicoccus intestinalis]AGN25483.1 hypothetical protein MMINT_00700 [Candidatus Methanomassiliicoccus intestinalis Issoire-Mx1]TQS82568.1 MAG: hypothetical protein A3207_08945 [Candidatus Methanomassiliicoccus intestinalis]TQS83424.1 MAG: hypothetical protein A3206_08555 [Candidatus Methanomassiliicoccus intestinalis]